MKALLSGRFLLALPLLAVNCAFGQTRHTPMPTQPAATTLPALFLSDIHFDPFVDPAKAVALNSAPASDWNRIFNGSTGSALTHAQQAAFAACNDGLDTPYALWQSTIGDIKKTAGNFRFVIISGDLLAHRFDCKYKALVPGANAVSYLAFTQKTVEYILTTLRNAVPGVPIYTAMGNNDSGCTDYALDATHDAFLKAIAPFVVRSAQLAPSDRALAEQNFTELGAFNAPLAALPHTRVISIDDLYLSAKFMTCAGAHTQEPAAALLAWLKAQLEEARKHHDRVWIVGHIPPGVDLYATARRLVNVCGGAKPTMFLGSEELAETLAAYSDVVHLALFGHTHDDELRLLTPHDASSTAHDANSDGMISESARPEPVAITGVPLKIVSSITPVHGNRPTYTLARVNAATATLVDYSIRMASDPTKTPIEWSPKYTYSTTYHQSSFDAPSLAALIGDFQGDPGDKWPTSQAYIRNYFPAGNVDDAANSAVISAAWEPYACTLNHVSAKSFAACVCTK